MTPSQKARILLHACHLKLHHCFIAEKKSNNSNSNLMRSSFQILCVQIKSTAHVMFLRIQILLHLQVFQCHFMYMKNKEAGLT